MSDGQTERFDGIAAMRAIRDRMNEELADSTVEEVREWLDSYEYKSPTIRRLAEYHKSKGSVSNLDSSKDESRK